jgi:hypothetical protein
MSAFDAFYKQVTDNVINYVIAYVVFGTLQMKELTAKNVNRSID